MTFSIPVLVPLDHARDAGIQRRLLGPGSEARIDLLADVSHVGFGILAALEFAVATLHVLIDPADLIDEVLLDDAVESVQRRERLPIRRCSRGPVRRKADGRKTERHTNRDNGRDGLT